MAVGAGGAARRTDQGDGLPLRHPVPHRRLKLRAVGVISDAAVAVVDLDEVAVGAFFAGPDDFSPGRRRNGRPQGNGDVQAPMKIFPTEDGPGAERGRDAPGDGPDQRIGRRRVFLRLCWGRFGRGLRRFCWLRRRRLDAWGLRPRQLPGGLGCGGDRLLPDQVLGGDGVAQCPGGEQQRRRHRQGCQGQAQLGRSRLAAPELPSGSHSLFHRLLLSVIRVGPNQKVTNRLQV